MNERSEREILVQQATHSALLEGLSVSPEFGRDSNDYVAGTITADELVLLTRKRLGLVPAS